MKVVSVPDVHPWNKELECTGKGNGKTGCGATLLVEHGDLWYWKGVEYPWRVELPTVGFTCANCGVRTDIPREDWPDGYHDLPTLREVEERPEYKEVCQ